MGTPAREEESSPAGATLDARRWISELLWVRLFGAHRATRLPYEFREL